MENRLLKIKNPEKFRNNVMIKINKLLNDEKKSLNVEKSIFNFDFFLPLFRALFSILPSKGAANVLRFFLPASVFNKFILIFS
jgi:hypothetical protein